jgi:beta-lactamase class A
LRRPLLWLLAAVVVTGAIWSPPLRAPKARAASSVETLYSSAPDSPDFALQQIIEDEVAGLPGDWGVAVKKLDTGQYAAYKGDVQQVSASLYKLWVLSELYHQASAGAVSLDDETTVTADDAYYDALLDELRIAEGTGPAEVTTSRRPSTS